MSKNSELMQQQMEKHPDMRLVVEQEENPPVIHEKRNGYARIVCLVDAYFHSPSLSEFFGFGIPLGLTDALHLGGSILDFAIPDHEGKLSLVPRGSFPAKSANQHDLDAVKNWLDELRREFDSVLINAPPLNRSADGIAFGKLADGLVPVLKATTTQASVARRVVGNLRTVHLRVVGAVLNQCPGAKAAVARGEP